MGNQSGEGGVGVGVVGSHGVKVEYESSAEDESDDGESARSLRWKYSVLNSGFGISGSEC